MFGVDHWLHCATSQPGVISRLESTGITGVVRCRSIYIAALHSASFLSCYDSLVFQATYRGYVQRTCFFFVSLRVRYSTAYKSRFAWGLKFCSYFSFPCA